MVSTSDFDSDDIGSNPVSITNVGFSLTGKAPLCESGEKGSRPEVNRMLMTCSSMDKNTVLRTQR